MNDDDDDDDGWSSMKGGAVSEGYGVAEGELDE